MYPFQKNFQPDSDNILEVLYNRKPKYLPLYEHNIDRPFIEKVLGQTLSPDEQNLEELIEYYRIVTGFWKDCTYDAFSFEAGICPILPGHGAIMGGTGPIQTRVDFEHYPFEEIPALFWKTYTPHLEAIRRVMPQGMKAYGGCGYGIFETAQDLVGFESLCMLQFIDPDLFRDLFAKIGDLFVILWNQMTERYSDIFVFYRMGDDLGYRTGTMLDPETIRKYILPQHKRVIDIAHNKGKKFLLHSCGNIFTIMDDILTNGIDAKHSNEDQIAPFKVWIEKYNDRIGLFGGFDMNELILNPYDVVYEKVLREGTEFRKMTKGYALGSGNSIPDYMSVDGFMAMIAAVQKIRELERGE